MEVPKMRFSKVFFFLGLILFFAVAGYSETDVQKGTRLAKMYDDQPSFEYVRATINLKIYNPEGKIRFTKTLIMASHTENPGTFNKVEKFIGYFTKPADDMAPFKGKEIECYMVECLPKSPQVKYDLGYGKKIMYFEKKTLLEMKTEYYDENMVKWKEQNILSFITKNNVRGQKVYYTPGSEMRNVQTGTKSRISFSDFLFEEDAKIDHDIFTLEYLTRKWW